MACCMVVDSVYEKNIQGIAEVGCSKYVHLLWKSHAFINSPVTDLMEGAAFFIFVEEETKIEI